MAKVLHGTEINEQINASADKTQVYGLKGDDTLISDNKKDVMLIGGSGDDSLVMTGGTGTLNGGAGKDVFEFTYSAEKKVSAVIEDFNPSEDKIVVNFDGDIAPQLTTEKSGADVVYKSADGNLNLTLKSVRDNDYFDGEGSVEAWQVLELTNIQREAQGLNPLTMSKGLMTGAVTRAAEITDIVAQTGALEGHYRRDNSDWRTVLVDDNSSLGAKYNYPGENLDAGAVSAKQVVEEWMGSESHKENILNPNFQKLGIGYTEEDSDPSDLRFYWVQLFADSLKSAETVSAESLLTADIETATVKKFITDNSNDDYGVTIAGSGGNDSITNTGLIVSISGGAGDDTISTDGSFTTVNAGTGNDIINLASDSKENVIQYATGDGADTISGLNPTDIVSISGDEYTPAIVDNDIVVAVGNDSITLLNAAKTGVQIIGTRSKLIILTEDADDLENTVEGATITALGGNDWIRNYSSNVTVSSAGGNDSILNSGANVSMNGGEGNDYISNDGENVSIDMGEGNDSVWNYSASVTIDSGSNDDFIFNSSLSSGVTINTGAGNDSVLSRGDSVSIISGDGDDLIRNFGESVTIDAGDGKDSVRNYSANVTISSGAGNDLITNDSVGSNVSIDSGDGNDYIFNEASLVTINAGDNNDLIDNYGSQVSLFCGSGNDTVLNSIGAYITIDAGSGNDSVNNASSNVTIHGGSDNDYIYNKGSSNVSIVGYFGNDTILNEGSNVTVNGGYNNDIIILSSNARNNLIEYSAYGGRDTVRGFNETDTLKIGDGTGTYSAQTRGNDFIVNVSTGSVTLLDAASLASVINIEGTLSEANSLNNIIILNDNPNTYVNSIEGRIILAFDGNDSITNNGANVSIDGGLGNDLLINQGSNVYIVGGVGNDNIFNTSLSSNVSIAGSSGNDTIISQGTNVTTAGGDGNDLILFSGNSKYNLIQYTAGNGSDTIYGFTDSDTLMIDYGTASHSIETIGSHIVVNVDTSKIILAGAASLESVNIVTAPSKPSIEGNFITLSEGNDTYYNYAADVTIAAHLGDDHLENMGSNVSINGGSGDDDINNLGSNSVTIDGADGNDDIYNSGENVSIDLGAGNDSVMNTVQGSFVTINGNAGNDFISNHGSNVSIEGGIGNDSIFNNGGEFVTIDGGEGDEEIENYGLNVSINAGDGNDRILNSSLTSNVTITTGEGDDSITNGGSSVTINLGTGNDTISNTGSNISIVGDAGNDLIYTWGDSVLIDSGSDSDTISNYGNSVSINAGTGDDLINNTGENVLIKSEEGNDHIINSDGLQVTIDAGEGNDIISNSVENISIAGGSGDDSIYNDGANVTITGGTGNDLISLSSDAQANVIQYHRGDGNDTIWGYGDDDTLDIFDEANISTWTSIKSGEDIVIAVGDDSIWVKDRRDKPVHIIIGESGTAGGLNGDGGNNSSGGRGGNGRGGNDGGGDTSGGRSSDADGNANAVAGATSSRGSDGNGNSGDRGGNDSGGSTSSTITPIETPVDSSTQTPAPTSELHSYRDNAAALEVETQPAPPEKLSLSFPTNWNFPSPDKIKLPSLILDGTPGNDELQAGVEGYQLWGHEGDDTLIGGDGYDVFFGGKDQGSDTFLNVSASDVVYLSDVTFNDLSRINKDGDTVNIAFKNGNSVTIQSTDTVSGAVIMGDLTVHFTHQKA